MTLLTLKPWEEYIFPILQSCQMGWFPPLTPILSHFATSEGSYCLFPHIFAREENSSLSAERKVLVCLEGPDFPTLDDKTSFLTALYDRSEDSGFYLYSSSIYFPNQETSFLNVLNRIYRFPSDDERKAAEMLLLCPFSWTFWFRRLHTASGPRGENCIKASSNQGRMSLVTLQPQFQIFWFLWVYIKASVFLQVGFCA